jgi:eukaryotic-like serine/threonine-protein kinase
MTVAIGSRLGPFEIVSAIGAGGMGEVYRARDTNLARDVAIKVLPDAFARDTDRMARFGREAKLLAALNHSNIASIHGLEISSNIRALVMELAEGPTLAGRIAAGRLPIDDALRIARQLCEALEYAHEKGIIHRDLKPANIKVAADGTVKILDFGLAKAMDTELTPEQIANSPTLSRMATQAGVLLGTAAYMSPEQAKGKPVDRRADIWAFGCVLYEMLAGKMAFQGETVTDTLAAVIKEEPDWSKLPAATPTRIRVLLQRCLQKDPKQRLQAIGDARISIEEVLSGAPEPISAVAAAPAMKSRLLWFVSGAAGLLLVVAVVFAFLDFHRTPPAARTMHFEIPLPAKFSQEGDIALSPDGRKLAFIGTGADGQSRVWIRSIDSLDAEPLEGTNGAGYWPFWSPDSRFIAFEAEGKLKKIDVSGGPPITLCDATSVFGGAWTPDDNIVFGSLTGLVQVAAAGGSASPLTTDGPAVAPSLLPDGRHFLYLYASNQRSGGGIYVGSVDAPGEKSSKKLLSDLSTAVYAPSPGGTPGYLLFTRGAAAANESGTLMVQRFDARRLKLIGEAVPIAEQVSNTGFSASSTDALVYEAGALSVATGGSRGNIQGRLTWFDREGKALDAFGDPGLYRTFALSPDGKRVAFERADPQNPSNRNIWLYDFARGVTTRFTFDSGWDSGPIWSPDGTRIVFGRNIGNGNWDLYEKASNLIGEAELLFKSPNPKIPTSWSPDGRFLLFQNPGSSQVWILPLGGTAADRKPVALEHSKFVESYGKFSPDGRWIAYTSDESGKSQIYVQPFNAPAAAESSSAGRTPITGKWMVSSDGGTTPLWERDGKELFYLSLDGEAMAVDVNTSGIFQAGVPKPLFKTPPGVLFWDISSDGKRFLMVAPSNTAAASAPVKFTVVLNWQTALNK